MGCTSSAFRDGSVDGIQDAALRDRIFGPVLAHVHAKTSNWHEQQLHYLTYLRAQLWSALHYIHPWDKNHSCHKALFHRARCLDHAHHPSSSRGSSTKTICSIDCALQH